MEQTILSPKGGYEDVDRFFRERMIRRVFLVCGNSISKLNLDPYFKTLPQRLGIEVTRFSRFQPNPRYESVCEGVEAFRHSRCDCIVAVGGGSAMDVAKCVKLFAPLDPSVPYLRQELLPSAIPLLAVPTTAGTGSEATGFAVIYEQGVKRSVAQESSIPDGVLFDPSVLTHVPDYHRKATMLDALCHSVEAFWSVQATPESREYSTQALQTLFAHWDGYLDNRAEDNEAMQQAAYLAGKAINLAKTTAAHAMSYKMTSLYGIAHGHAAALCLIPVWSCLTQLARGEELQRVFSDLARAVGCLDSQSAVAFVKERMESLGLGVPIPEEKDFALLTASVDPQRLGNTPVTLDNDTICQLYRRVFAV